MPARDRKTQIRLDHATAERLRAIALDLGFVQKFGPLVGEGSTIQMLEAVARGEYAIEQRGPLSRAQATGTMPPDDSESAR